jgi:NADH dehydrogenase
VAEHAVGIKTLGDAVMLRAGVLAMLEAASVEPDPERRKRMLTFVVVGGGFAGVETVGALNDLARQSLRHYGQIDPGDVRVLLIHGGPVILPELGQALGLYAQQELRKRQVEIKLKTKVISYTEGTAHCDDGEAIPANVLVWAGGVAPSPLLKDTLLELQRGRVVVDSTLKVPQFPGVWAVGDCAAITDPTSDHPYPPTAQHAVREGLRAAKNLCACIKGERATPFVYRAPGQLASIGRRTGVARIMGLNFSGVIGWVLWRTVYLLKLPRLEKKIRVGLQWAMDVVFERDLAQYITRRDIDSINRLLEIAQQPQGASSPEVSAVVAGHVGTERIASYRGESQ